MLRVDATQGGPAHQNGRSRTRRLMRLRRIAALLIAGLCSFILEARNQTPQPQKEVTYTRDIAPILNKNCVMCHRPDDVAPMSLMTYADYLLFATIIQYDVT